MGAACIKCYQSCGLIPKSQLPETAVSIPESDPEVQNMLQQIQGEWRIVPMDVNVSGHSRQHVITFDTVFVNGASYTMSGSNSVRRGAQKQNFKFSRDPSTGKIYLDEWGSQMTKFEPQRGELCFVTPFASLMWKRPDSWFVQNQAAMQQQSAFAQYQYGGYGAPPTYQPQY